MVRVALHSVGLMALYCVLSGEWSSVKLLAMGAVASVGIALLARRLGISDGEGVPFLFVLRGLPYFPWLVWQVMKANWDVVRIVWGPRLDISPEMVSVSHKMRTGMGIASYANSITLTPGTVTARVEEDHMWVHALTRAAADDLRSGSMQRRILRIEGSTPT